MPEKIRLNFGERLSSWIKWGSLILVLIYQLLALVAFTIYLLLANNWMKAPFIGAFVEHTLYLSSSQPSQSGAWRLVQEVKEFGYHITGIDGQPITSVQQLNQTIASHQVGDTITVQLGTPQNLQYDVKITLINFPVGDRIAYFYIPFLIGLIYLGSGLWVFGLRRRDAAGRAFAVFTTSVAISAVGLFDISTTNQFTYLWTISIGLLSGSLLGLAVLFPQELRLSTRHPYLRWAGYLVSLVLIINALPKIYNFNAPEAYVWAWRWEYIFAGLSILAFLGLTIVRYYTTSFPVVKEQARLIMIGAAISFVPMAGWFLVTSIFPSLRYTPYLMLPVALFPVITAYTILRYRLLHTDYLFSRALIYGLLTALVVACYAFLVTGLSLIVGTNFLSKNPWLTGLIIFILALAFSPFRNALQRVVDAAFARSQAVYRDRLQSLGHELTRAMELPGILLLLRKYVQDNLMPTHLHIFIHDPLSDHYIATQEGTAPGSRPTSDLRFSSNSALAQTLAKQHIPIFLGEASTLPLNLQQDRTRISLLGSQLFVPLPGRQKLTGWLALGQRRSGEPYNHQDLEFLESLCDQTALAIERAQVVADLERRVHAMNVLARVSQGINVTVLFDDILELIYAQTNQVIPTRDFRVILYDKNSDFLYHVFNLDNDDRLREKENIPLPIGQGLEREVLSSRRALVTDDYERECRSRGTLPASQGLFAWVGVALNTGAETIGVISLASRDPAVIYTDEQINLLQAIADQAAGAIVKARLLEEAELRTKQLTSLNEVARSLTSTLELDPLLNQILNSAVEIINCEAGSLLLVDAETGELVFEVVVSPVASDLLHTRLPAGTGLVGKAVDTRLPLIQNDVRRSKEWYDKPDEQTGFTTHDLLVVPMQVKDKVLGVIEVINRKDRLPFTTDDQELLMAFTSQAAVALENARLYTLTDQTLAARVEELSVMQRIDRELNASLDVSRAIRITLEWAMRQSKADAGLVGVKEGESIRIMDAQGYSTELNQYKNALLPVEFPSIKASIETGQPQFLRFSTNGVGATPPNLLSDAKSQGVIPIRREAEVIGIVLLESMTSESYPEETLAFLSRLSDHASIAISNAQLYTAVQAANLAKSDFVSFVSHELKTPMTSIKGFTDLLAGGMVGPVNDAQANFLNTIRSNVDRMATLVSDLADVSRIEAGRLRLDFQAVPIEDVVEDVVRSAHSQIEEKQQNLNLDVPKNLPALWGDRTRLIQVLTNLVNNAFKYTPQNGNINVKAELTDNHWDPAGAPKVVHISVQDTGIGISLENQKKIFQKFFRADDQKVRDIPGTGLGLNITKTLVEMQGGQIWFESAMDQGTTFHFTVPIVESA